MAIGSDRALPSRTAQAFAVRPNPPSQQPAAQSSVPAYGRRPPAIADSAVQSAVNNQLASSYGARETAMSSMDRGGMSRGRGQRYMGTVAQESADADAQAAASQTAMGAAQANARANQEYENTMKQEQLANSGLLEGLRNTAVMERLARMGWRQDMNEAIGRGRFGLASMQLDYSPLLQGLFN